MCIRDRVYVAGKPCGLFGKTDLDMTAFYDSYMAKIAEPVWSILVALYFLDDSCDYMVPEARTLSFEGDNYMEEILYQLSLGPANKSHLTSPLRSNYAFTYQGEMCIRDSSCKLIEKRMGQANASI